MKILIVEDDHQLNIAIEEFCTLKKYRTFSAKDGLHASELIDNHYFDFYIIDINLPYINGLDLVKQIRTMNIHSPIIIISASSEMSNFAKSFENGCSDYIKKPFRLEELYIRMNHLLSLKNTSEISITDDLQYNYAREEFIYLGKAVKLRYKEKRLCLLLMNNLNTLVKNEAIYNYVWEGEERDVYPVRQMVTEIRKKLPQGIIQTVIKEGYFIESKSSTPALTIK